MDLLKVAILIIQMGTAPSFPDGDASSQKVLANKIVVICNDTLHVLRNNPEFKKTTPSVFNQENIKDTYISLTQIDSSYLFSEDCDYSLLNFLRYETAKNSLKFIVLDSTKDIANGESFRRITWDYGITLKLFENQNIYSTSFDSYTEFWKCNEKKDGAPKYPFIKPAKTELRKNLNKEQQNSVYDVLTNPIFVFSIVPGELNANTFISNLTGKSVKTSLVTFSGRKIEGRGIVLNGDNILDAFWFLDVTDSPVAEWFIRLYINIEGEWVPIWYRYFIEK